MRGRIEGGAGAQAMEAAALDLAEMGEQVGQRDVAARRQPLHGAKQLVVGDRCERLRVDHVTSYTRDWKAPTLPVERGLRHRTSCESKLPRLPVTRARGARAACSIEERSNTTVALRKTRQERSTVQTDYIAGSDRAHR